MKNSLTVLALLIGATLTAHAQSWNPASVQMRCTANGVPSGSAPACRATIPATFNGTVDAPASCSFCINPQSPIVLDGFSADSAVQAACTFLVSLSANAYQQNGFVSSPYGSLKTNAEASYYLGLQYWTMWDEHYCDGFVSRYVPGAAPC